MTEDMTNTFKSAARRETFYQTMEGGLSTRVIACDPKTGAALEIDRNGRRVNEAAWRRAEAEDRRAAIAAMGWAPEDGTADGRYVATVGELLHDLGVDPLAFLVAG